MRVFVGCFLLICSSVAMGQGTPPMDPERVAQLQAPDAHAQGEPPQPGQADSLHRLTGMVKSRIKQAINGRPYPLLQNWRPLTTREKLDVFLKHTYAGRTFASAAIDA